MNILITGAAGFIGFHLSNRLCQEGYQVTGIDNLNPYYDVKLKESRLDELSKYDNFRFERMDLGDSQAINKLFEEGGFEYVVNLAAQAGVRHSLKKPHDYINANITGFLNILEACRNHPVKHLVYASSSSVYGANREMPFTPHKGTNHPVSLYAATKKSNELMAHAYAHLFDVPSTGLRFFTVYGPYGRPDMALFLFTEAILKGEPINVFNYGKMKRDFTYIADIVESIKRLIPKPPVANEGFDFKEMDPAVSYARYQVFNIGNSDPVEISDFIDAIEEKLGKKAERNLMPMQDGDVPATYAYTQDLEDYIGYKPGTSVQEGISNFIDWYLDYYQK